MNSSLRVPQFGGALFVGNPHKQGTPKMRDFQENHQRQDQKKKHQNYDGTDAHNVANRICWNLNKRNGHPRKQQKKPKRSQPKS